MHAQRTTQTNLHGDLVPDSLTTAPGFLLWPRPCGFRVRIRINNPEGLYEMTIQYLVGDATLPIPETKTYIVHVCNNKGGWVPAL